MNPQDRTPTFRPESIMIAHSELMRVILLALLVRRVVDRQTLDSIAAETLGGIREHGYDGRFIADAERYLHGLLADAKSQLEDIERLSRQNENPN